MDSKAFPIDEIAKSFDFSKTMEILLKEKQPKIETIDYLLKSFNVSPDSIHNKDIFLRNYIYSMVTVRKHLIEIDERISRISQLKKGLNNDSYEMRKLQYFEKKNFEAKKQIINFINYDLLGYLTEKNDRYSDLIDMDTHDSSLFWGPKYDYQFNSKYYDPNYDFSTSAKFIYVPGKTFLESLSIVENAIQEKINSIDEYQKLVILTVEENNVLSSMVERVDNNYHLYHRKEIFDSMMTLFQEEKYLTFIINATIQIEGIFFDWLSIKFGEKEKQGTLVEKVNKSFDDNEALKNMLYPYFAFDIPTLRNQVAHKGIVDNADLKQMSYELILDLNCALFLAEKESNDKIKTFLMISDKLNEVEMDGNISEEDYNKKIAETLLEELFLHFQITNKHFWDLLKHPENFDEELDFYINKNNIDDNSITLKEIVKSISDWCKKPIFWNVINENCTDVNTIDNYSFGFGAFIKFLVNNFIPILEGDSKTTCCQINSFLQENIT